MEKKIWYLCDPEKNVQCKKTYCAYNPNARKRKCFSTTQEEFARLDFAGRPCENPAENRRNRLLRKALESLPQKTFR